MKGSGGKPAGGKMSAGKGSMGKSVGGGKTGGYGGSGSKVGGPTKVMAGKMMGGKKGC
jgi:hypothetical protein